MESPLEESPVTPTIAAQVLHELPVDGVDESLTLEPGSFVKALIAAIAKADPDNRLLLRIGFPGYVDAVTMLDRDPNGVEALREIAEGVRG